MHFRKKMQIVIVIGSLTESDMGIKAVHRKLSQTCIKTTIQEHTYCISMNRDIYFFIITLPYINQHFLCRDSGAHTCITSLCFHNTTDFY